MQSSQIWLSILFICGQYVEALVSSTPLKKISELELSPLLHNEQQKTSLNAGVPYIIDRVSDRPNDKIFDEIAAMCIDVFFNNDEGYQQAP